MQGKRNYKDSYCGFNGASGFLESQYAIKNVMVYWQAV